MEREITHIEPKNDLSGQIVNGDEVNIIGAKVVRGGPNWMWGIQAECSEYGIVQYRLSNKKDDAWYNVHWFDSEDKLTDHIHNYRAGKVKEGERYDLLYY